LQKILEVQTARQEIQEEELQRAREIQQGLMPREIPQIAGFEIAGAWEPAREVGGDYFDVIRLSDTKLALCIADVVGKGVSAALLMANVQASVRAFASETASPSWVCSRVNSVICTNIASGKFVTLFYGVLDAETMTLLYTNAGHLRPILVSAEGKATELDNGGALLGVFPGWTYEDSTAQLRPGDRLWLVTDGITEASAEGDEEFGVHRLLESAKSLAHCTAPDCKTRLLTSVRAFCNAQFSDDATLVVLAVN
jgi:sigma-B regulation protein RsbU (phosphoserine phosphatase)